MSERLLDALVAWRTSLGLTGFAFTHSRMVAGPSEPAAVAVVSTLVLEPSGDSLTSTCVPYTLTETLAFVAVQADAQLPDISTAVSALRAALHGKQHFKADGTVTVWDHLWLRDRMDDRGQAVITWRIVADAKAAA